MADLATFVRQSRTLRVVGWCLGILTICFFLVSKTRWYQIEQHRGAMRGLQMGMYAPQPAHWKSYLNLQSIYFLLHRHLTPEEKMERMLRHQQELLDLGYLEEERVPLPPGMMNIPVWQIEMELSRKGSFEPGEEFSLTFRGTNLVVLAPSKKIRNRVAAIQDYFVQASQVDGPASKPEQRK
jgi:hypothetical protein